MAERPEITTYDGLLAEAAEGLRPRLGVRARGEARYLVSGVLGRDAAFLIAHGADLASTEECTTLREALARRAVGEPLAYLTGRREFYGRSFRVTPATLIPRADTEVLVEAVLAYADRTPGPLRIADLGTGSGAIAATLGLELTGRLAAPVVAIERSPAALTVARDNGAILDAPVEWVEGDWYAPLSGQRFDVIVSNPPYVEEGFPGLPGLVAYEPAEALRSGPDGLNDLTRLIDQAPHHLRPGGLLALEHGHAQGAAVRALMTRNGLENVSTLLDMANLDRVTVALMPAAAGSTS